MTQAFMLFLVFQLSVLFITSVDLHFRIALKHRYWKTGVNSSFDVFQDNLFICSSSYHAMSRFIVGTSPAPRFIQNNLMSMKNRGFVFQIFELQQN